VALNRSPENMGENYDESSGGHAGCSRYSV